MKVIAVVLLCVAIAAARKVQDAPACQEDQCSIASNCKCSSTNNPINSDDDKSPQLLAITVSESIVETLYDNYLSPLFFARNNPDGNPAIFTFYVNHEYTDYTLVNDLYALGYEIGVHSITKEPLESYWKNASFDDLVEEFKGQKTILNTFANIPAEDITGVRTPQLQLNGDISINAYVESELSYDNSWPTLSSNRLYPYTLDFKSKQQCTVAIQCPSESHPGFWIAPVTDIQGKDGLECNSLATCDVEGTADEIATWLIGEVNRVRDGNRAPLMLRLDSYWFDKTENSYEGFEKFLDQVEQLGDTYLVSVQQVVDWVKNPVPASAFSSATPERVVDCEPHQCQLKNPDGENRYMRACISCPKVYPWKGNPLGEDQ